MLRERLLCWFAEARRPLPWRRAYDPYHVYIAEIMLQQTRMERGVRYFERWLARFPSLAHVAAAGEEEILSLWEGLGYYARAGNLHRAARVVVERYGGRLPDDYDALLGLPGIGRYTAAAVMSIGFGRDFPVVDGNVERVFARLFCIDRPVKSREAQQEIHRLAARLLPPGRAREWNQALMELGALVCRRASPLCDKCPLAVFCRARKEGVAALYPQPGKRAAIERIDFVAAVIENGAGEIYVQKRLPSGLWANMWEFPGGHLEPGETPAQGAAREVREETEMTVAITSALPQVTHSFTRYRATVHAFRCALTPDSPPPVLHAAQECRWLPLDQLDTLAFSAGHRKVIEFLERG